MINKIPVIGVMGSGTVTHEKKAVPLGSWIARNGFHLLTGGGGGVMSVVSKAFCEISPRTGLCIGIIPGDVTSGNYAVPTGYPNPYVEVPIRTHLPLSGTQGKDIHSRNHINILSTDFIVALPGSAGTCSEVELALTYKKPIVGYIRSMDEIVGLKKTIPLFDNFEDVVTFVSDFFAGKR